MSILTDIGEALERGKRKQVVALEKQALEEGKGIEMIDLGVDVAAEDFVKAAVENDAQIICCSALLTTTMNSIGDVTKAVEAAGIRDKVKIMVGGAPVTQEFCDSVGADYYTVDAASAAIKAAEILTA